MDCEVRCSCGRMGDSSKGRAARLRRARPGRGWRRPAGAASPGACTSAWRWSPRRRSCSSRSVTPRRSYASSSGASSSRYAPSEAPHHALFHSDNCAWLQSNSNSISACKSSACCELAHSSDIIWRQILCTESACYQLQLLGACEKATCWQQGEPGHACRASVCSKRIIDS